MKISRQDEPILIDKKYFLKSENHKYPVVVDKSGKMIPTQLDDLNSDGVWDVLAFVYTFKPREKAKLSIRYLDEIPSFKIRTNVRLGKRNEHSAQFEKVIKETHPAGHVAQSEPWLYQFEGPGWENDKVAFRAYFDSRNGRDVFGKVTDRMVLDSIQLFGNYHEFNPNWGMDVLKVGKSLGAGALAFQRNNKLYRFSDVNNMQYEQVTTGPVRSILKFRYKNWLLMGDTIHLTEEIAIWAGKYGYERKVSWSTNDTLICGLPTLHNDVAPIYTIYNCEFGSIATHSKQSENKDILGLAIVFPKKNFVSYGEAPPTGTGDEITQTVFTSVKKVPQLKNEDVKMYFYAGWEKSDKGFESQNYFRNYLQKEIDKLSKPITIKIK